MRMPPAVGTALMGMALVVGLAAPAAAGSAALRDGRRLTDVTFLMTHNSFANSADGIAWSTHQNQNRPVRQQLPDTVRGLMLDIHEVRGVRLCHGSGWLRQCGRALAEVMTEVVAFLRANRNEIITISFEDYTGTDALRGSFAAVSGLAGLVFDPQQHGVGTRGWPTVDELVRLDKRLVMFSSKRDKGDLGVRYAYDWMLENHWEGLTSCEKRGESAPLNSDNGAVRTKLLLLNHNKGKSNDIENSYDRVKARIGGTCMAVTGNRKPNFIAVDYYEMPNQDVRRYVASLN